MQVRKSNILIGVAVAVIGGAEGDAQTPVHVCTTTPELNPSARRTELSKWHNVATDALAHEKSCNDYLRSIKTSMKASTP